MPTQYNLNDIVDAIACPAFPGVELPAFSVREQGAFFVSPELVVKEGLGDVDAQVLLISARGAAGKSTAAEELSRRLQVPLWKLEDDKAVSATALDYSLSRYLRVPDAEASIAALDRPLVLIDSLDEARARVSGTSWSEFLESIATYTRTGCRFVLLGRERTLEEVWLALADADITLAWLEISHFGLEQRLDYVDGRVRARAKSHDAINHPYYAAARDAVISSLTGPVVDGSAEAFVGYAPVLDAVAAVLFEASNLFDVANQFSAATSDTRHLEVLQTILQDLLLRDQLKMRPVAEQLGIDPQDTYTPDEQIDWLCHDLLDAPAPSLDYITNAEARDSYMKGVRAFVDDHPFRNEDRWASAVFTAFVASRRFGSTFAGVDLLEVGNASGFLFDLVALAGDVTLIDEWQFAALHASVTAGEYSGSLSTVLAKEAPAGGFEVDLSVFRNNEPIIGSFSLLPEDLDAIRLFGPLEGLTVQTSGRVVVPVHHPTTVLGPDLFIRCASLVIEGESVEFANRAVPGQDEDRSVGMVILEVEGSVILPPVIARRPLSGDFELRVPGGTSLVYPWHEYGQTLEDFGTVGPSDRAVRFLNMLMNLTRTHGHSGERGSFVKKLQGRQSVKGAEFTRAAAVLSEFGVAYIHGDMIYIRAEFERYRFSGKTLPGQRLISDVWDVWGPIAEAISKELD